MKEKTRLEDSFHTEFRDRVKLAVAYYRLSREEAQSGESSSISNQRKIVENYCKQNDIILLEQFVDDGWSGSNFQRPGFQQMLKVLESGKANMVITKDLSRLGRDMREASYYAEQYFPENLIHYIAIADNFDSEQENIMAPFQFAMNEVYLRDGSRKIREVLKMKRSRGEYCACPPFGYKKDPRKRDSLIPDENTAPTVQRIFNQSASGDSCRKIAMDLTAEGVIPPLKYRALYRDQFTEEGAARASDAWNYTTVKRILQNRAYLGETLLGKTRKVNHKSDKKISIPMEDWAITQSTHEPLVDVGLFELAQATIGHGTRNYQKYDHVRKSIFGGIAVCSRCGHALCSSGTVYKGEREKYWFLSCNHSRKDIPHPCEGVRIRYADLLELVRQELNQLIRLSDEEITQLVERVVRQDASEQKIAGRKKLLEKAKARMKTIDHMVGKLYQDNAEGNITDERLRRLVSDLEDEYKGLEVQIAELSIPSLAEEIEENYHRFFEMARELSDIQVLDRKTLVTFVEKIEVGPKVFPDGYVKATHRDTPFQQSVRIFYRFVGELPDTKGEVLNDNDKS